MDCKITFTNQRAQGGFSLAEVLIAAGLGSIFFIVIGSLIYFSAWSFVSIGNYIELENSSRLALDTISRDIRQSTDVASWNGQQITLNYTNGVQLIYTFNPSARTLRRTLDGNSTTLLTEVDTGLFSVFQRNPVSGAYDQYPVGTPGTTKLVQVDWQCSRRILQARINTESVQSAKIVIRRQ